MSKSDADIIRELQDKIIKLKLENATLREEKDCIIKRTEEQIERLKQEIRVLRTRNGVTQQYQAQRRLYH